MRDNLDVILTDRQERAWLALDDPKVLDVLYGGAKGGGKSYFLCAWAYTQAYKIAERFKLKKSKNPIHIGWIGRKQATDFKGTTLKTWRKIIPEGAYELKGSSDKDNQHILIDGRIAIDYGGLDKQENINKFNSAEYAFICVDQAEEVSQDDISVLQASRRLTINGEALDYKGLYTANPRQCWLKDEFIDIKSKNKRFIQALPADNPYLPKQYVELLKESFKHRPELLEAYLFGVWNAYSDPAQVIQAIDITAATKKSHPGIKKIRFIAIDPARFGDDECVLMLFENTDIIDMIIFPQIPADRLNLEAHKWAIENKCVAMVIDESGLGGPVVDWQKKLAGNKYRVIGVQSEALANDPESYFNTRAEMWMETARMFSEGDICLSTDRTMGEADWLKLKAQLCTPSYDFRGQKVIVESKKDIKKRLLCSPDRADCAVMGWYKWPVIKRLGDQLKGQTGRMPRRRSAMAS